MANVPNADHQFVVTETSRQIGNFVFERKLGRVLVAPFEVHLAERSRPVQPDLLFVRAEGWPTGPVAFFDGAPDLIVEVVSPSSVRTERVVKFTAYENAGVPEYWIANPHTRTVEVYTLSNGEYALLGEFTGDERLQSLVLTGIDIVGSAARNRGRAVECVARATKRSVIQESHRPVRRTPRFTVALPHRHQHLVWLACNPAPHAPRRAKGVLLWLHIELRWPRP